MTRVQFWIAPVICSVLLSGCVGSGHHPSAKHGDPRPVVKDGGPDRPVRVDHLPDAMPKPEKRTRAGNKSPYTVNGKTYRVLKTSRGFQESGIASWYGTKFHGRPTANGERYDMYAMTAAHKSLPIPSYVRVTNRENNRSVVVRVNDRGPFHGGRVIDLSYAAAAKLGYVNKGTASVDVIALDPTEPGKIDHHSQAPQSAARAAFTAAGNLDPNVASNMLFMNRFLQAGAFSSESSALSLRNRIAAWTSYPVIVDHGATTDKLFRVRIGPISRDADLNDLRTLLEEKQLPMPHIVYD